MSLLIEQIQTNSSSRIIGVLSIAVITLVILLFLNLYKVYKLKSKLSALENK